MSLIKSASALALSLVVLVVVVPTHAAAQSYDPPLWSQMRYRFIGPLRGGRVTAVAGVPAMPFTFYFGSTGGGVWRTTDAGHSWLNLTDGQIPVGSIGAIDVSLSEPQTIYVGTGSSKIRSNVSIGRGMYKSIDGGRTWRFSGLRNAGQIAAVRTEPANADMVFVAALGNPFAPNDERGIFRTTDGGQSWSRVLFVSDSTGAADVELMPGNTRVLYAAMWRAQRKPWTIVSGAREGGIYKSTDAGDTWTRLGGGLPTGLFGRSKIAISSARPSRVYALIEARPGSGLYRSDDGGATWTLINDTPALRTRPFYFTTLYADPTNADVVFVGDESLYRSSDGGATFHTVPMPHGDHHDLWINPTNSEFMIEGNDGGAVVSLNGGRTWSSEENQPTAEIYQLAVDHQYPYRVYGAQQDQDPTLIVPSRPLGTGQAEEWRTGPGCETGPIVPNAVNPDIVYGSCVGRFSRMNLSTGEEQQYWVGSESLSGGDPATLTWRFQRVAPIEVSPHDVATVYYGSQYLHRSRNGGRTWERISPDLTWHPPGEPQEVSGGPITRDASGEEIYSALYAIRESPRQRGLIWTGSNDGRFSVTRDGGTSWTDVTPKDLPRGGRVQNIEPSPHRPGTAYFVVTRFLNGGDFSPYVYRTDDYGTTWKRLTTGANGIAADEPVRVVREDPVRPRLLYAGTEFGMFISFDDGEHWQSLQFNLPATPVTDIRVTQGDLALSTQGRGFWILDNITPLRQLSGIGPAPPMLLFKPRDAVRSHGRAGGMFNRARSLPDPPVGAMIDYCVGSTLGGDMVAEILDAAGRVIRTLTLETSVGFHRVLWDLRYPGAWQSDSIPAGTGGPLAPPGTYEVRLRNGPRTRTQPLTVVPDPRVLRDGVTVDDLRGEFAHDMRVRDLLSDANRTLARLRAAQFRLRTNRSADDPHLRALDELESRFVPATEPYSRSQLLGQISYLYLETTTADQRVGGDALARYRSLRRELDERKQQLDHILTTPGGG